MKYLDFSGLEYLINEIKDRFVQKVTGKDLSTNDFTNPLKSKLDGIEAGAEVNEVTRQDLDDHVNAEGNVHNLPNASTTKEGLMSSGDKSKLDGIPADADENVIELIKRNGSNLPIGGDKSVDISVPTKLSDLTNDKTFQTKAEIQTLISEEGRMKREIVTELPPVADADENTLYLIANSDSTGYIEWILVNGEWNQLGDTSEIDLTGYLKESDLVPITEAEILASFNA